MHDAIQHDIDLLRERLREISDLGSSGRVLAWDQATHMPTRGSDVRGRQLALLGRLAHERQIDPGLGTLLERLRPEVEGRPEDDATRALVEVAWRDYERAARVPADFVGEFAAHQAHGYEVWKRARRSNDFKLVAGVLERTLALSRQLSSYYGRAQHVADPLIDDVDPGFTAERVSELFGALRDRLVPLVEVASRRAQPDGSFLARSWAPEEQLAFCADVVRAIGYDFERGRLDTTQHPFMVRFGHGDIRITTRADADNLVHALFAAIHEAGHALYELGIDPAFDATPLGQGAAASTHESQSRLWENRVARSHAFWVHVYPQLRERTDGLLSDVALADFVGAVNVVRPSLIRVDADELTYNLHVMLRFDLEIELLEGRLAVADLPRAWDERMEQYLGVRAGRAADGVLQDVHWFAGRIGGEFQGYALGNIMSAQFYEAALRDHPTIPQDIASGRYDVLLGWLRRHVHRYGRMFRPLELIERATGAPLSIEPYLTYLSGKYLEGVR